MICSVTLPWPDRVLSANARVHWSVKAKAAKKARADAAWAAKAAGIKKIHAASLAVSIAFAAPDRRQRDLDGMLTSAKSALDGIADVVGVDDSKWALSIRREAPQKPGSVRIEIEAVE